MPKSPEDTNAYYRKYLKERYRRRKQEALQKLGGCCARCGSTDNLEVDHIDRLQEHLPFSRMYAVSQEKFEEELSKCQLLCKPCHTEKTIDELGHNRKTEHGTLVCYQRGKCRCPMCKAANAANSRAYRDKKIAQGFVRKYDKWVDSSTG